MPVLPNFRLETYFSQWEFTARYHLTASDAQSMTLHELLTMANLNERESFEKLWLGYTETFGTRNLRQIISSTYNHQSPENILCFAGAEEGIYIANHTLLTPQDHVIVIIPNYQAIETIPLSICAVTGIPLDSKCTWDLDIESIAAAIQPNTKLVSINFPHNPTGKILEPEQLNTLVALCRHHGIWLFSDEVYRLLGSDPSRHLPQVADMYERGLSLNVMSKAYGLPGLRIGWIACSNRDLLIRMERMKHYLSICNSAPSEILASIALRNRESILARNNTLIRKNLVLLDAFFAEFPTLFEWQHPDGSCVAYPRYIGSDSVEDFTTQLIEQVGVLLLPANIYRSNLGPTPTDRFRIGFGRADFAEGLTAFRSYCQLAHQFGMAF